MDSRFVLIMSLGFNLDIHPYFQEPLEPPMPSLRDVPEVSSEPFIIDKDGEMPEGAVLPPLPTTPSPRPSGSSTPVHMASFPAYDVPDSDERTATPTAIKVRSKKKTGTGKKKRAQPV